MLQSLGSFTWMRSKLLCRQLLASLVQDCQCFQCFYLFYLNTDTVFTSFKMQRNYAVYYIRFKVFIAVKIHIVMFWVMTPCSLQHYRGTYFSHLQGWRLKTEAICFSEILYPSVRLQRVINQMTTTWSCLLLSTTSTMENVIFYCTFRLSESEKADNIPYHIIFVSQKIKSCRNINKMLTKVTASLMACANVYYPTFLK
jgi:hypothetical protein